MAVLPSGTVTFVFTDIEGSTRLAHTDLLPFDRDQSERNPAALRTQLDPAAFDAAWAEGRAMTMEQAVAYALDDNSRKLR